MITTGDIVRLKPSYKRIWSIGKFPLKSKGNLYKVVRSSPRKVLLAYLKGAVIRASHQVLEIEDPKGRRCRVPIEYLRLVSPNMNGIIAFENCPDVGLWIRGTARSPGRKANIRDVHPLPWIVSSSDFGLKKSK